MYRFYFNKWNGDIAQIYVDGPITDEIAERELWRITEGHHKDYDHTGLAMEIFNYAEAELPMDVPDNVMNIWKFHGQKMNTSTIYEKEEIVPYYAVVGENYTDKVEYIPIEDE